MSASKDKKQKSEEEKRRKSEAISRIVLPLANATLASVARVLVEQLFKGA